LVWAIVAAVLIVLALLPRVGGGKRSDGDGSADRNGRLHRDGSPNYGKSERPGSVSAR
ncbi:MAG: hypothetical protein QOG77_424, partial [Solirubrobacteraceae bacterium]|nr:hypothetical protein [Solirubrobacteraceae bacterium]